jgi:hypothetical protein
MNPPISDAIQHPNKEKSIILSCKKLAKYTKKKLKRKIYNIKIKFNA